MRRVLILGVLMVMLFYGCRPPVAKPPEGDGSQVTSAAPVTKPPEGDASRVTTGEFEIVGPFKHKNLAVYLIKSRAPIEDREYITLEEAMKEDLVVVGEYEGVQKLYVENKSDKPLFIQAGDILKGGKQDRVIHVSMVIPPRSGKVELPVFCVERGRWSGGERFQSAPAQAYTAECLKAAIVEKDQTEVWEKVADAKSAFALHAELGPSRGDSALEEFEKGKVKIEEYEKALLPSIEKESNIIGIAYCINGNIQGAGIYSSASLFKKMLPKLLKSFAAEAIVKTKKGDFPVPQSQDVANTLENIKDKKGKEQQLPANNIQSIHSDKNEAVIKCLNDGKEIHTQYIKQ